ERRQGQLDRRGRRRLRRRAGLDDFAGLPAAGAAAVPRRLRVCGRDPHSALSAGRNYPHQSACAAGVNKAMDEFGPQMMMRKYWPLMVLSVGILAIVPGADAFGGEALSADV